MQQGDDSNAGRRVKEMAIVDTFTKLIFGEENNYSAHELQIIEGFRLVEIRVAGDTFEAMGNHLRRLGVREMIQLVSRLREQMEFSVSSLAVPAAIRSMGGGLDGQGVS